MSIPIPGFSYSSAKSSSSSTASNVVSVNPVIANIFQSPSGTVQPTISAPASGYNPASAGTGSDSLSLPLYGGAGGGAFPTASIPGRYDIGTPYGQAGASPLAKPAQPANDDMMIYLLIGGAALFLLMDNKK